MAGLPKKYAKMGFAKGWRAYKASKSTTKVKPMARRKRTRRARTRSFAGFRKKRSRSKSGMSPEVGVMLGGAAYGAVRAPLSNYTMMAADKVGLPKVFGQYTDEAVMLGIAYMAAKGKIPFIGKNKLVRQAGRAGLAIESAIIGRQLTAGIQLPGTTTAQTGVTQTVF